MVTGTRRAQPLFPSTQERDRHSSLTAITWHVTFHLSPLLFGIVAECAELLLKFIQLVAELHITLLVVVTVLAQFSNQPVVVFHLLLLVVENLLDRCPAPSAPYRFRQSWLQPLFLLPLLRLVWLQPWPWLSATAM